MLPRRRFLFSSLALAAFESLPTKPLRSAAPTFKALPAWKLGVLEIHQIATNRGNSTLLILPDGTTMMVDAGAIYGATPYLSDPLYSKAIYPGSRDVFATSVKQENRIANKKTDDLKSRAGHIVIRVEPGGETFAVHILSNADENDRVTVSFGPYTS